jgi:hypothetical protein
MRRGHGKDSSLNLTSAIGSVTKMYKMRVAARQVPKMRKNELAAAMGNRFDYQ